MRIEEKFKDFRHAFRTFDKNYDGSLSFKEFMSGLENIGIRMNLPDFHLIFDMIDYDKKNEIDFSKFCLLNIDKLKDIHNYLRQETLIHTGKMRKPPLAHRIGEISPREC